MSTGDDHKLAEVLASLDPLGPEDQLPDVDGTLLPAKEINLRHRPPTLERYEGLTGAPDQQAHTLDYMPAELKARMIAALERELGKKRMTVLAMYAQHGSCSYGEISATRLRSILRGDTPTDAERVRFEQAMLEMPADSVPDLAAEIGMTAAEIEDRTIALCGHAPGVHW